MEGPCLRPFHASAGVPTDIGDASFGLCFRRILGPRWQRSLATLNGISRGLLANRDTALE